MLGQIKICPMTSKIIAQSSRKIATASDKKVIAKSIFFE
jgi:hypothetical protein